MISLKLKWKIRTKAKMKELKSVKPTIITVELHGYMQPPTFQIFFDNLESIFNPPSHLKLRKM